MADSFTKTKRELFELMQQMRHTRYTPPMPEGLTPVEARTVIAIDEMRRCHGEMRPGRVAEFTHTTPSALSQTFKSLEEKGLIERHRAGGDYREVSVGLTQAGEQLAAEGRHLHDEHMSQVMAYVGEEDVDHLVRILHKVIEFYKRSMEDPNVVCDPCGTKEGDAPCA